MTELLTAAQMRAIEQAAIDSGEVTGLELMERAGAGVVEAIFEWRPELAEGERKVGILCGPGNNGGDGFVVARLLHERGWIVRTFLYGNAEKLPPDAKTNLERWSEIGTVTPLNSETYPPRHGPDEGALHNSIIGDEDLIIDALFGTGLSRPFYFGEDWEALDYLSWYPSEVLLPRRIVAIDCVSGFDLDSGTALGTGRQGISVRRAGLTVTFEWPKIGHYLADGPLSSASLVVKKIGLEATRAGRQALNDLWFKTVCVAPRNLSLQDDHEFNWAQRQFNKGQFNEKKAHKYDHGHVLVVSGGMAKTGAARLAARGALRVGAGVVTVASPPNALMENAAYLTTIMVQKMKGAEGLSDILSDDRINAVVIGPGCGVGEETRALVEVALSPAKTGDLAPQDSSIQTNRGPGLSPTRFTHLVVSIHV